VAAFGNAVEWLMWKMMGGMPSEWIILPDQKMLAPAQIALLEEKMRVLVGIAVEKISGMEMSAWRPIRRQIYVKVMRDGETTRIDTFNANYGLTRGLACAMFALGYSRPRSRCGAS
jgi:hypothetical protein